MNTTQVDEFALPLTLDVWGNSGTFHQRMDITESVAQIDSEFVQQVPVQFQPAQMSDMRIPSPTKVNMAAGAVYGNYFDGLIANVWKSYAASPVTITVNGRQFVGTSSGSVLTFTEVNPSQANAGETFIINQPSTQDILACRNDGAGRARSGPGG
ncbi:beta-1,3-glucanase family protein [Granulicella sp. dw_53]|uniref:beta-1,3-glucanase family protein n=1 Tax=Granulicella sp. dw_53 TaxID=2719792 RepID=UPI0031F676D5